MLSAKNYRIAFLSFIFFIICISSYSQQPYEIQQREARFQSLLRENNLPAAIQVPVEKKIPLFAKKTVQQTPVNVTILDINKSIDLTSCKDSSFKKIFTSGTLTYNLFCSAKTSDGGIILGGSGRNYPDPPPYIFYGMIVKFDSIGNFLWGKQLKANGTSGMNITAIQELSDGSIIISGTFDNTSFDGERNGMVTKLSSTGGLVWVKTFKSQTLVCSGGNSSIVPMQIAEGANGDVFVSGSILDCASSRHSFLLKYNSTGSLKWNTVFQYASFDGTGFGVIYENNTIKLLSRAGSPNTSDNVIHVDAINVDYNTGTLSSYKSWQVNPSAASFVESFSSQLYAGKMDNGNYCVYGELFGDYQALQGLSHHFAVLEFNKNDEFIKGYTINSALIANADGSSSIKIDKSGRVVFSLFVNYTGTDLDLYMGSVNNGNILKQRLRHYSNTYFYNQDNWELFSDRSYIFLKLLSNTDNTNERIEYSKMYDTDTSGTCLGLNSDFCFTTPAFYIPYNFRFANIYTNPLYQTANGGLTTNSQIHTPGPVCKQIGGCDTLKIHGNNASCNFGQDFIFTAYKNPECGSRVTWTIDTSTVSAFQQLNDTTIKINFRSNWQGYLHAMILTSCGLAEDSIFVNLFSSPSQVNLGPDQSFCFPDSVLLNAGKGYTSYEWQDGSVDSTFTVTKPGIYSIKVLDACGETFRDTINITAAPSVSIDLGPDRIKCNNDTIHLDAPSGFLNYTWSNDYSISSLTSQNVIVNPPVDTSYYIKAEKTSGCFAFDTVKISVHHSPIIDLGSDKNFCIGDSAVFDAGNGFTNYSWSTGSITQYITVKDIGSYSVMATTSEGCKSYDSVKVLNVFPDALVTLDHDSSLCKGSNRILNAGNFISYLWNNGSDSRTIIINSTGVYAVSVTDNNGCKGTDTTVITNVLPSPVGFLPPDTTICSYGTLDIKPIKNFRNYLWSNNLLTSAITISKPGTYWLQVTDDNNCEGKDTVVVVSKDCLKGFYIPSAFTPNNDGVNDIFRPLLFGNVKKYQFTIYNRWSEKVFQTAEPGKGWDGIYSGRQQDTNIFLWICSYQLEGEAQKIEKGTVLLIR